MGRLRRRRRQPTPATHHHHSNERQYGSRRRPVSPGRRRDRCRRRCRCRPAPTWTGPPPTRPTWTPSRRGYPTTCGNGSRTATPTWMSTWPTGTTTPPPGPGSPCSGRSGCGRRVSCRPAGRGWPGTPRSSPTWPPGPAAPPWKRSAPPCGRTTPTSPSRPKLRNSIYVARKWLGVDPTTGQDYLPSNTRTGGGAYRIVGGLLDAELFRRLRLRGVARGERGIPDLRAALDLVTGAPFDRQRPGGYGWLVDPALDHDYTADDRRRRAPARHPPPGRRRTRTRRGPPRRSRCWPAAAPTPRCWTWSRPATPWATPRRPTPTSNGSWPTTTPTSKRTSHRGPPRSCAAAAGYHPPPDRRRRSHDVGHRGRLVVAAILVSPLLAAWTVGLTTDPATTRRTVVAAHGRCLLDRLVTVAAVAAVLAACAAGGDPLLGVVAVRHRRRRAVRRRRRAPSAARPAGVPTGRRRSRCRSRLLRSWRGNRTGCFARSSPPPLVGAGWFAVAFLAPSAMGLGDVRVAALAAGLLGWTSWSGGPRRATRRVRTRRRHRRHHRRDHDPGAWPWRCRSRWGPRSSSARSWRPGCSRTTAWVTTG